MRILPLALLLSAASLPALAQPAAPSASALHLRMLTWPGKVAAPGQQRQAPAPRANVMASAAAPTAHSDPAWRPAYRPVPHGNNHMLGDLTPAQAQAVAAQRAAATQETEKVRAMALAQQAEAGKAPPPALPTSIYAAPRPAAQSAPTRIAAASPYDQKAHYYSLHRAYGDKPDPISLSPQFLSAPSADLADPPPPPPPRIMPGATATAAQQTAARVQQRDSADSGN